PFAESAHPRKAVASSRPEKDPHGFFPRSTLRRRARQTHARRARSGRCICARCNRCAGCGGGARCGRRTGCASCPPSTPPPPAHPPGRGPRRGSWLGFAAAIVGLLLAGFGVASFLMSRDNGVSALDARLAGVELGLRDLSSRAPSAAADPKALEDVTNRVAKLE